MVDELDPIAVDNAVRELYGKKTATTSATAAKTTSTRPRLEGLNPDLLARVQEAQVAYREQFGRDLPITRGVSTREEQEKLVQRAKAGEKNIFMPTNPANFPNKQIFHADAVDIDSKVPESFLNKFGIHRPLGSKDPVHAVLMPSSKETTTTQSNNIDLSQVDSMVQDVYKNPPTKEAKGVKSSVGKFLSNLGASAASMADVAAGVIPAAVGAVTYAGARQFQSPEEAAKTQQKVMKPLEQPFGKAFGVTESPAYKGELTRQLTEFIGENVGKGADWIAEKTGMPKSDVEYYMNLGMFAVPAVGGVAKDVGAAALKSKPVQAVVRPIVEERKMIGEAVSQATPQAVKNVVGRTVEAVAPGYGITKPAAAVPTTAGGQPFQVAPYAQTESMQARGSVGAAAAPNAAIIQQALNVATPEFKQLYGSMPLDKVNAPVVLRHLEADALPIPIRLTEGQATGDLVKISKEQNIRGTPEGQAIAYRLNEQNKALVDNVPLIKEQAAPDVYATRTIESSEALINAYKELDTARNLEISKAYKELENANGGAFPVDGATIAKNAEAMLSKKLKTEFLPPSIKAQLDRFKSGEPMTFEQFEALRTNLAGEIRKAERSGDGNSAMASSIVRQAMEDLPLQGNAASLKPLADNARNLAKSRFDALKKDPAYRASVNDTVPADKFFDKFVIRGVNKNVDTMINTFGQNSVPHQHVKAGTINWLSDKAGIVDGKGNFSQANYNKGLKSLDDVKNYQAIFDPQTQLQLKTLGNVANYTQFQPRGSYVNNSNTLVGYLAKAANMAESTGNVAGLKFIGGYPIGTKAREFLQSRAQKAEIKKSLQPGAGSNINE